MSCVNSYTDLMFELVSSIQPYAWGMPGAISTLFDWEQTSQPEAELWLGAHPANPSHTADGRPLHAVLSAQPDLLGESHTELPYLLKVLAAGAPLSIQVHPSRAQASAGFARENAQGLPANHPTRNYQDAHDKPEMLVALTTMEALAGFAPPALSHARLTDLASEELHAQALFGRLLRALDAQDLAAAMGLLLSGKPEVVAFVGALQRAATARPALRLAGLITYVSSHFPNDPGLGVVTLLNHVHLQPGEAIFVDAGIVHSYLRGIGIEIQAPSNNVLRGGLTPKHVDRTELQAIMRFEATTDLSVTPTVTREAGVKLAHYAPPVGFGLTRVELTAGGRTAITAAGPRIVLAISTDVTIASDSGTIRARRGQGVFIPATATNVSLVAPGKDTLAYVAHS